MAKTDDIKAAVDKTDKWMQTVADVRKDVLRGNGEIVQMVLDNELRIEPKPSTKKKETKPKAKAAPKKKVAAPKKPVAKKKVAKKKVATKKK